MIELAVFALLVWGMYAIAGVIHGWWRAMRTMREYRHSVLLWARVRARDDVARCIAIRALLTDRYVRECTQRWIAAARSMR